MTASGHEVDFCAERVREPCRLIQVCADPSEPRTRLRELRALGEAMQELGSSQATMVTLRQDGEQEIAGGHVRIIAAWRWLLEGDNAASGPTES